MQAMRLRHLSSLRRLKAQRLLREGMAVSDAAQRSGMSRMHVGIRPPHPTTHKSSRRMEAERFLRDGVTARETAQRSGSSERRIHQLRAKLGIKSHSSAGLREQQGWAMQRGMLSPCYTTDWHQLRVVGP